MDSVLRLLHRTHLTIEFKCSEKVIRQNIISPHIREGSYYENWTYKKIEYKCEDGVKEHKFDMDIKNDIVILAFLFIDLFLLETCT